MPETNSPLSEDSLDKLLYDIDVARGRLPLVLGLAELTLDRSDIIWQRIQEDIEKDQAETEDALRTLRIAGLLKD